MNINHIVDVKVSVAFPALDNLVAYLRENEQPKIDAITAQVGSLTKALKTSGDGLSQAITTEQK